MVTVWVFGNPFDQNLPPYKTVWSQSGLWGHYLVTIWVSGPDFGLHRSEVHKLFCGFTCVCARVRQSVRACGTLIPLLKKAAHCPCVGGDICCHVSIHIELAFGFSRGLTAGRYWVLCAPCNDVSSPVARVRCPRGHSFPLPPPPPPSSEFTPNWLQQQGFGVLASVRGQGISPNCQRSSGPVHWFANQGARMALM